jgi:hypothetical protein
MKNFNSYIELLGHGTKEEQSSFVFYTPLTSILKKLLNKKSQNSKNSNFFANFNVSLFRSKVATMIKDNLVRKQVCIDPDIHSPFKSLCASMGVSVKDAISILVRRVLDNPTAFDLKK